LTLELGHGDTLEDVEKGDPAEDSRIGPVDGEELVKLCVAHGVGAEERRVSLLELNAQGLTAGGSPAAEHELRPQPGNARRDFTCSPRNATGRVPWPGCASASWRASSASRPASASTTDGEGGAVPWSTTAPEGVGVESII
jgi:hypothetical protein